MQRQYKWEPLIKVEREREGEREGEEERERYVAP